MIIWEVSFPADDTCTSFSVRYCPTKGKAKSLVNQIGEDEMGQKALIERIDLGTGSTTELAVRAANRAHPDSLSDGGDGYTDSPII